MKNPNVFVSYDPTKHQLEKILFTGQIKNAQVTFSIVSWSFDPNKDEKSWEEKTRQKLLDIDLSIILVGKETKSNSFIANEIKLFNEFNIPFFGVYIDDKAPDYQLPIGLLEIRTVIWDWEYITQWVNQCMMEKESNNG